MNKKSQMNNVFVYLLSIIMVLFVGFLVTKFIISFTGDVESRSESKLYDTLKQDFTTVYRTFGSEKAYDYRVSNDVDLVCFVEDFSCIDNLNELDLISSSAKDELKIVKEASNNVAIFDNNGIVNSQNIGSFKAPNGCFCVEPKNNRFSLVFQNNKNVVSVEENN